MPSMHYNLVKKDSGNYLIVASIFDRSIKDRVKKSTGHSLTDAAHWDKAKQRVKAKAPNASNINKTLTEWEIKFNKYVSEREQFDLPFKVVDLIIWFQQDNPQARNSAKFLTDAFLDFMDTLKLTHKEGTIKKYEVMYHQLLDYELSDKRKHRKIVLPEVGWDFYNDLAGWLISHQNNVNKTILRKLNTIRTVMDWATDKKKYIRTYDWKARLDLTDVDPYKVPLTDDEIEAFGGFMTSDLTMRMIADAFMVGLYCGFRYSDLQQLSRHHIHLYKDKSKGVSFHYINLSNVKGLNKNSVPIPDFLMGTLDRYSHPGRLFRLGENSLSNRLLKQIAEKLKLTREIEKIYIQGSDVKRELVPLHKAISFHFARYTYTYLQDSGGLQATYIQQNLGHRQLKTTMGYLRSDTIRRMHETIVMFNRMVADK